MPDSLIINDTVFNLTLAVAGRGIAYLHGQSLSPS